MERFVVALALRDVFKERTVAWKLITRRLLSTNYMSRSCVCLPGVRNYVPLSFALIVCTMFSAEVSAWATLLKLTSDKGILKL